MGLTINIAGDRIKKEPLADKLDGAMNKINTAGDKMKKGTTCEQIRR